MKIQSHRHVWLILVLFILALPLAALAADPVIGSAGPLSWQQTRVPSAFSKDEAIQRAGRYLGTSGTPSAAQFVQVTDLTPYGNVKKTVFYAWLVTVPGVPVENANSKAGAAVEVSVLVDADNKGLDAAFTAKNGEKWVDPYPGYKARDPNQVMADDGWNLDKPLTGQPGSTVAQVLSAFWKATGISPAAGQLFLRPRYAEPSLPAKREGNKLVPLRRPGTYWALQLSGTKTLDVVPPPTAEAGTAPKGGGDTPYMSGLVALFDDYGARSVRGVYLP